MGRNFEQSQSNITDTENYEAVETDEAYLEEEETCGDFTESEDPKIEEHTNDDKELQK